MGKYKPDEYEITTLRNRFREYQPRIILHDYEIQVKFESSEMAHVYLDGKPFRFQKEHGRWVCTRGIQD